MKPRTKRQREILNFIRDFIESHGFEPSYQQIANHIGVKSKGGIAKHIAALEKKGLLARHNVNGSFRLEVTPLMIVSNFVSEIEWQVNPYAIPKKYETELLYVPNFLLGYLSAKNIRALTVHDNGMFNEQILDGDIALIEKKTFIRDGEIIAALVPNEPILLRKFYRLGSTIELVPENENYETIIKPADQIVIIGVFRGILRPMI
jgi:repressor LexA